MPSSDRSSGGRPHWIRLTALLAETAGLGHDLGKAVRFFQQKLREDNVAPLKDPVRHEWFSLRLFEALREGAPTDDLWDRLARSPRARNAKPEWFRGITHWTHALEYLIASHHKLMAEAGANALGCGNHVREGAKGVRGVTEHDYRPWAPLPEAPQARIEDLLARIRDLPEANTSDPYFWRAVATIGRACLVLADHHVSARPGDADTRDETALYANTRGGQPNQSLAWHLNEVGRVAGELVEGFADLALEGLGSEAVAAICQSSGDPRFRWQDTATDALRRDAKEWSLPTLIVNMAGTGSGKTRMNAKALCALSVDRPVRMTTALNLRSLTLQTGTAFRNELGISRDEMACVIGDRVVQTLHEHSHRADRTSLSLDAEDIDGNPGFDFELDVAGATRFLPQWLADVVAQRPGAARMLGPPVLVATVDTIIKSGEPQYQGHHAVQLIRVAQGDLILDELDGYDPDALVAVLRLVTLAGMFGRHVVASSATLPRPVLTSLVQAFQLGVHLRARLHCQDETTFKCAYVDDQLDPAIHIYRSSDDDLSHFAAAHWNARVAALSQTLQGASHRMPTLQSIDTASEIKLYEAAEAAVERLHRSNCWSPWPQGPRVSFGLVRCANIRTAIPLARSLATQLPQARIACYHSQDLLLQRHYKEQRLDELLNRKAGNHHIAADPEMQRLAGAHEHEDLLFVVVATPVEEIGRDHDFDWAVIEPSSTHSIVQTAGRVNRHRVIAVTNPNVAILQFNARHLRGNDRDGCAFVRPGLETPEHKFPSHNMADLLAWKRLTNIDSRLRYDENHPIAAADNNALEYLLKHPSGALRRFLRTTDALWTGLETYERARLRNARRKQRFCVTPGDDIFKEHTAAYRRRWIPVDLDRHHRVSRVTNDWLVLDLPDLCDWADNMHILREEALSVSIPAPYRDRDGNISVLQQVPVWDRSFGWYFAPLSSGLRAGV